MFKAKLIENGDYYKLRNRQLLLLLLPSIPIGLLVNFYQIPMWVTILMIGLYIVAIILMVKNQKRMNLITGNRMIEINTDEIKVKSKNAIEEETINLSKVEKIIIKDGYSIPQETIKEVGQEIMGKPKRNYLIIYQDSQKRQLDFEIDSHYMTNQLNKLIESWKMKGYNIGIMDKN